MHTPGMGGPTGVTTEGIRKQITQTLSLVNGIQYIIALIHLTLLYTTQAAPSWHHTEYRHAPHDG